MARWRARDKALLYETLARLQRAGVSLLESWPLAAAGVRDSRLRRVLEQVRGHIVRGTRLSEALADAAFTPLEVALIDIGERNGRLDRSLQELAALFEQQDRVRRRLRGRLTYPALLLLALMLLPAAPTWVTAGPMAYLREVAGAVAWSVLPPAALLAAASLVRAWRPVLLHQLLVCLPVVGRIARWHAGARFCRALSALLAAGVELREALDLARQALGNLHLYQRSASLYGPLERGATLAEALQACGALPNDLPERVAVGERTGELDRSLAQAAEWYELEAEQGERSLLDALPVLMYLLIAVRVGSVVVHFYHEQAPAVERALGDPEQP
ncbi:MAG: type II secretion system F family protein [Myxococcales bacterium]|nr:type II secretion system F family protein [Myxococcota bacterium]MDW8280563.1 type II secretion system F family protein [Myxococcales bacterium]